MDDQPETNMSVDPAVERRLWILVAEAAAMHRRLRRGEKNVCYGDPDLQRTAESMANGSLRRAVEQALDARVGRAEIVDAICSGDRGFDAVDAHEFVEAVPELKGRVQQLTTQMLRDLFGEDED